MAPTTSSPSREVTPPRKSTSGPRASTKRSALYPSPSQPSPRRRLSPPRLDASDAERIEQAIQPLEFGIAAARRASMPTKYLSKEQTLVNSLAGPLQPLRSQPAESSQNEPEAGPSSTDPSSSRASPSARTDLAPPAYTPPVAVNKTDAVVDLIYRRLDNLVFNLPAPIFKPITEATFERGGRGDLVEKRSVGELADLVATHAKTWHASRCNLSIPKFDPTGESVTCTVMSESEHFTPPSHMFVLTTGSGPGMTYTYVPVHDVVYLTQCAGIRPNLFPPSNPKRDVLPSGQVTITLPIVRRDIPANQVFSLLDQYLYQQNLTFFFQQLISPVMPTAQERPFETNFERCRYYVKLLLDTFNFQQIGRRLLAIHHLHQVAKNLGIVEAAFWRVVNVAWFCCGAALKGKKADMERTRTGRRSASMPQTRSA